MGAWIVTAVCVLGLAAAAAMVVRAGRLPVEWRLRDENESAGGWPGARRALRSVGVAFGAGLFAGVLVAGLGGRLFMRIAAATSPESAQGAVTDAEEIVGQVTAGGSIGFVLFVGVFGGGVLGLVYRLVRPFLPGPAWFAGMVPTAIFAGLLGAASGFSDPDNKDFAILEPTGLIAVMIVVLTLVFGATLGATHEWLDPRVPTLGGDWRDALWYIPVLPYALVPPLAMAALAPVLFGATATAEARDVFRAERRRRVVTIVIAIAAGLGALRFLADVAAIAF